MLRRSFKGKEKSPAPWYIKFTYFRISTKRTCSFGQIRYFLKYALQGYCILVNTKGFLQHLNQCRIFSLTKAIVGAGAEERSSSQSPFPHLHSAKPHRYCCKVFFGSFQKLVCLRGERRRTTMFFTLGCLPFFFL